MFSGQLLIEGLEEDGSAGTGGAIVFEGDDGKTPRVWAVIRGVKENSTVENTDSMLRFYNRSFSNGLRETMRIDSDGIVFNSTGSWATFSDRRLKEDIQYLDGALDRLLALEGVTFRYREPESVLGASGPRTGFIAQQVETVFPEWVSEDDQGMKYVAPIGFEALTVEALRELAERQESMIFGLRKRLDNQQSQLARLEMQLRTLVGAADVAQSGALAAGGQP